MKTLNTICCTLAMLLMGNVAGRAQTETPTRPNMAQELARKIEKKVADVRGLKFQSPTKIGVYTREELIAFVKREMAKETSQESGRAEVQAHALLNLMPADFDLHNATIEMLGEQIGGFYDPEKKELVLVKIEGDDEKGHALHEVIMSHELVHALQDQHFNLSDLHDEKGADRDRKNAILSLIEGDATLMMMFFSVPGIEDPSEVAEMLKMSVPMMPTTFAQLAKLADMAAAMGQDMDMGDGLQMDALAKAPTIMSDEMCFSYMGGLKFVFRLFNSPGLGGTKAIDAAFLSPPLSTEQILHPKKYMKDPDWPVTITLPDLSSALPKGTKRTYSNNLGELHVRTLLATHGLKRISRIHAGWDGDRLELYETPNGPGIVWYSRWDSEDDAAEFLTALTKIVRQWVPAEKRPDAAGQPLGQDPSSLSNSIYLQQTGTDVLLLRGFTSDQMTRIVDSITRGLKVKAVLPWTRKLTPAAGEQKK